MQNLSEEDIDRIAERLLKRLGSPSVDLGRSGLLELIIGKAVEKSMQQALDKAAGKIDLWVTADEYRKRYHIKKTTFYQMIKDGAIPQNSIQGSGKARRFNASVQPSQ